MSRLRPQDDVGLVLSPGSAKNNLPARCCGDSASLVQAFIWLCTTQIRVAFLQTFAQQPEAPVRRFYHVRRLRGSKNQNRCPLPAKCSFASASLSSQLTMKGALVREHRARGGRGQAGKRGFTRAVTRARARALRTHTSAVSNGTCCCCCRCCLSSREAGPVGPASDGQCQGSALEFPLAVLWHAEEPPPRKKIRSRRGGLDTQARGQGTQRPPGRV